MDALGEEYNYALQKVVKELNEHAGDDFFIIWYVHQTVLGRIEAEITTCA